MRHSRRPRGRCQQEGATNRSRLSAEAEELESGDLESALCRFLSATVRKVASRTPAGIEESAPARRPDEIRVSADDADALFLLGLRGLMGALDAESKSRAQLDIARLLRERVAALGQPPQSCHHDSGDGDQARAEHVAAGAVDGLR